jgi:hypothetical protein
MKKRNGRANNRSVDRRCQSRAMPLSHVPARKLRLEYADANFLVQLYRRPFWNALQYRDRIWVEIRRRGLTIKP